MSRLTFDFEPRGRSGRRAEREAVRVLVIADLHGSAKGQDGLAGARIVRLSVDNFDDVLRRVQPTASVVAVGARRRLTFESMQDFHPDELYPGVELFAMGRGTPPLPPLPAAKTNARSADGRAAGAVTGQTPAAVAAPEPAEDDAATIARLLGRPASAPAPAPAAAEPASAAKSVLDQMLRELVAPHIVPATPQPPAAPDDYSATGVMREVLHGPEFQTVESTWRALRWLVCENPLGDGLEVNVLDASRDDLIADLRACGGEIERSQLHRLVVREPTAPGSQPFSLVIGDLTFAGDAEDVSLLAGLGAVAAQGGGCFLAAADPVLWGCQDLTRQSDRGSWSAPDEEVAARMQLVRASAVAPFIGLCAPRVLGRVPYGKRSDPIDRFDFTELPEDPPHTRFLWINGAFACAQLIFGAIARGVAPGSLLDLGDLPHAVYRFAGGDAIKPCAEVYLDETSAEQILAVGVMPFMSYRDRNAIRLLRLQSIASPAAALALQLPAR